MADGNRECVGLVRRGGFVLERENRAHHALHLALVGSAVPAHRLLDPRRRILGARDSGTRGGNEGRATRLTDRERDPRIGADIRLLDRNRIGLRESG